MEVSSLPVNGFPGQALCPSEFTSQTEITVFLLRGDCECQVLTHEYLSTVNQPVIAKLANMQLVGLLFFFVTKMENIYHI